MNNISYLDCVWVVFESLKVIVKIYRKFPVIRPAPVRTRLKFVGVDSGWGGGAIYLYLGGNTDQSNQRITY